MPEFGKKERNYLIKTYTGLEKWWNSTVKSHSLQKRRYTHKHTVLPSPPLPSQASLRACQSKVLSSRRKKNPEVSNSLLPVPSSSPGSAGQVSQSSQHHQLCCLDLQFLTQNHVAPSQVFSPVFLPHGLTLSLIVSLHMAACVFV